MKMPVPSAPANGNFKRDSAYPANNPQNSEIRVAVKAMIIVFNSHVVNKVWVSRSVMCSRVGCHVQNGA